MVCATSRQRMLSLASDLCPFLPLAEIMTDSGCRTPDAYHTNYVLAGLSSAQYKWDLQSVRAAPEDADEWVYSLFKDGEQIFDEEDRVKPVHPVYVIHPDKMRAVRQYFQNKPGF